MRNTTIAKLTALHACRSGLDWCMSQPSTTAAWRNCDRADWMLWLLVRTCKPNSATHRRIVKVTCRIATDAINRYWTNKEDNRPRTAIKTALAWSQGKATIDQVRAASDAAYAAAAATAATAGAAYDAAYAAYDAAADAAAADAAAAYVASDAAHVASDAAHAAADAADAADAARTKALAKYSTWVRQEFPQPPRL